MIALSETTKKDSFDAIEETIKQHYREHYN